MARALSAAGAPPASWWNRDPARLPEVPPVPGISLLSGPHLPHLAPAAVVVLAVSDRAVPEVGARLAAAGLRPGAVVLHLSGALPASAAHPGGRVPGVAYGAWHPLQALAGGGPWPAPFTFGVEGDPPAVRVGEVLAEALGCRAVEVPASGKTLYHAAAVIASNLLVALEAVAVRTLERAGVPREQGLEMLLPLVRGTVENLSRRSPEGALTGPVARGDAAIVAAHLAALSPGDPEAASLYRLLSAEALRISPLDDEGRTAVARALATGADPAPFGP